ncbi:MAG: lipoprotein insertase outer membrane protein LolB [Gammaproteobacteria bacterium]|nr:lipoprotein insertase outer membrane protein LolB [Gammaproteobacteria bacterium]
MTTLSSQRFTRGLLVACLLALLSACATTRPGIALPPMPGWDERQAVLGGMAEWSFKGRIAVKAGDEGFNGKFNWEQNRDDFYATVGGPLGIGTVRIEGDRGKIRLTDKDGVETEMLDPEAELYFRYGWTIPVTSLRFWALGIPDPGAPAKTEFDDDGLLTRLEQFGWVVTVSRYRDNSGQLMPRTLTATNPETRVRMVIDRWLFFER